MLLEIDGLTERWEDGVRTDWENMLDDDVDMPNAIRKLLNPSTNRLIDLSGMGCGNDIEPNNRVVDRTKQKQACLQPSSTDGIVYVKNLSLHHFHQKLIRHFNISFQQNNVIWPRRNT